MYPSILKVSHPVVQKYKNPYFHQALNEECFQKQKLNCAFLNTLICYTVCYWRSATHSSSSNSFPGFKIRTILKTCFLASLC